MREVSVIVSEILQSMLGVFPDEIKPESSLVDDLGADSLDEVELVMAFEESFDIEIPDEAVRGVKTVQDIIDYLNKVTTKGKP